ncbi:MAG TPA: hypothetical protein VFT66_21945 [Roseiflexaceae bacterium]|nr:hypothetical protein [Roseiflexaceae bacterium]
MATPESGATPSDEVTGGSQFSRWRFVLPHVLTAVVAIALSVAVQQALAPRAPAPSAAVPTLAPQPTALPAPSPSPVSTPDLPLAEGISRQEIADLHADVDQLWSAMYLSRAISQIADAETTLRANDRQSTNQSLLLVDDSLSLAYARAATSAKDPIEELRREVSQIHDDLYLRPEGLDTRFARLRQNILTLVETRQ